MLAVFMPTVSIIFPTRLLFRFCVSIVVLCEYDFELVRCEAYFRLKISDKVVFTDEGVLCHFPDVKFAFRMSNNPLVKL